MKHIDIGTEYYNGLRAEGDWMSLDDMSYWSSKVEYTTNRGIYEPRIK